FVRPGGLLAFSANTANRLAAALLADDLDRWVVRTDAIAGCEAHDGVAALFRAKASPVLTNAVGPLAQCVIYQEAQLGTGEHPSASVLRRGAEDVVAFLEPEGDNPTRLKRSGQLVLRWRPTEVVGKPLVVVRQSVE